MYGKQPRKALEAPLREVSQNMEICGTIKRMHQTKYPIRPAAFVMLSLAVSAIAAGSAIGTKSLYAQATSKFAPPSNIQLLQPLDGSTSSLPPVAGIQMIFIYFNISWPWVLGSAAGIAVLWALVGGIEIMMSGSNTGMQESGKGRLMWALAGLLLIGLAGFILTTLNPLFYV